MKSQKLLHSYLASTLTSKEAEDFAKNIGEIRDEELTELLRNDWNEFRPGKELDGKGKAEIFQGIDTSDKNRGLLRRILLPVSAAAAIASVAALSILLAVRTRTIHSLAENYVTINSADEGTAGLILPDGSKVKLGARSTLTYPSDFGISGRDVAVTGQAFFEVEKNPAKVFSVSSSGMRIKVTGTKFNVYSNPEGTEVEMALVEGSVEVSAGGRTLKVAPGEKARLDTRTSTLDVYPTDNIQETMWMNKYLEFKKSTLETVIDALQRRFAVDIHTYDGLDLNDLYTGSFSDNNIRDILNVLKIHYKFDYKTDGKDILLMPLPNR